MTSKKELEQKIHELRQRLDNFWETRYRECETCGGLFNKHKMKEVEIRSDFPLHENFRHRWYCQAHAPDYDIEEFNWLKGNLTHKKKEVEIKNKKSKK